RTQLFQVIDLRQHILRKDGNSPDIGLLPPAAARAAKNRRFDGHPAEAAFEQSGTAQIVLDGSGVVTLANRAARRLLSIGSADLGRHLAEAEFSFRPTDLRGAVERVLRERRVTTIGNVTWHAPGASKDPITADVIVSPMDGQGGVMITFMDVTRYQDLREELERSRQQLA